MIASSSSSPPTRTDCETTIPPSEITATSEVPPPMSTIMFPVGSLVSIPAGFRRMNFGVFTLYTLIGSAIWNTALIGAGYVLRDNWHDVEPILSVVQYVVIALIVAAIGW